MEALHPTISSKPIWMIERRLEHLKKIREVYIQKLRAIEAEITELEALLKVRA